MGAFKYVICWLFVAGISILPVIDPIRSTIIGNGDAKLFQIGILTITYSPALIPQMMSVGIMLFGSFIIYCIYRGNECTWRKEKMRGDLFVPSTFND